MNTATKIKSKIQRKWNYAWNDLRSFFGINKSLFQQARGTRIIVYHGICKTDHTRFNSIFLTVKTFEKHLQFYKKYFHVISLDDYFNKNFNNQKFNICITFDDGFANNHKYVLPLLNKYKVPATFFITAIRDAGHDILWNDFLCLAQKCGPPKFQLQDEQFYKDKYGRYKSKLTGKPLKDLLREDGFDSKIEMTKLLEPSVVHSNKIKEEDYWLQMTVDEIRELSASPFATIGSHGYYHNDLSQISINDARNEMSGSKQWLENITGKKINSIAFPYGAYTRDVLVEAKNVGFTKLLATDFLFCEDNADEMFKERMTINPYISITNLMTAVIKGKYE
jgi:peptidoglycan/xylan/chitin deacetylase (PgdA/CDA1 family)